MIALFDNVARSFLFISRYWSEPGTLKNVSLLLYSFYYAYFWHKLSSTLQ